MFKRGKNKLRLHKETLRQLTSTDLAQARGGLCAVSDGEPPVPTDGCACAASVPASRVVNTALYPCGAR